MPLKKITLLTALCASLLLTACAPDNADDHAGHGDMNTAKPALFDVDFTTATPIKTGDKVTLTAHVHQDGEPIDDAEVMLEYWREGDTDTEHQKVEAKPQGNGDYTVTERFTDPGTYRLILHTTANDLHKMPTVDFEVVQ